MPSAEQRVAYERAAQAQSAFVEALAKQWRGDHEGAISALTRLAQSNPIEPAIFDALAESHAALGQYAEALIAAEDAGRLAPDDPTILARLALEQRRSGQRDAAATTLERALRSRPADLTLLSDLADLYTEAGRDAEAVRILERLVRVGDTPAARLRLAAYARRSGNLAGAVGHLERASTLAPDESAVAVALADALAEANHPGEAIATLDRFLRRRPGDVDALGARSRLSGDAMPSGARPAEDRLARARDAFEASDEDPTHLDEAERLIASVLADDSNYEALALGGRIAFQQRRYALAADRLLHATEADPRDARAWGLALRALARSGDARAARTASDALLFFAADPDVAAGAAEALLVADRASDALDAVPDSPDGYALRAIALARLARLEDAADALGHADTASPLLLEAARGDLASAQGDMEKARAAWTRALAADPEAAWVRARLD